MNSHTSNEHVDQQLKAVKIKSLHYDIIIFRRLIMMIMLLVDVDYSTVSRASYSSCARAKISCNGQPGSAESVMIMALREGADG